MFVSHNLDSRGCSKHTQPRLEPRSKRDVRCIDDVRRAGRPTNDSKHAVGSSSKASVATPQSILWREDSSYGIGCAGIQRDTPCRLLLSGRVSPNNRWRSQRSTCAAAQRWAVVAPACSRRWGPNPFSHRFFKKQIPHFILLSPSMVRLTRPTWTGNLSS